MWDGGDGVEQSVDRRLFHWCKFSENQEAMQPREETDSAAAGSCDMGRVGGEGVVQPGEEDNEETVETMSDFIFGGSKITADGDCSH